MPPDRLSPHSGKHRHIKVRVDGCPTVAAAATLLLASLPHASLAAIAWDYIPTLNLQSVYESNPRYLPTNARSAIGFALDGQLELSGSTPTQDFFLTPHIRRSFYTDSKDSDLEQTDYYLAASDNWRGERNQIGVTANVSRVGVRSSEFVRAIPDPNSPNGSTDSGRLIRLDEDQDQVQFSPNWSYLLTSVDLLSIRANYALVHYTKASQSLRYDVNYLDGDVSLRHTFSPKIKLILDLTGSKNRYEQKAITITNDSDSYGGNVTLEYSLSPTMVVGSVIGGSRTVAVSNSPRDLGSGLPCVDPTSLNSAQILTVRCKSESSDANVVGQIYFRNVGERNESNINLGHTVESGAYSTVTRDSLNAWIRRELTSQLYVRGGVLVWHQQSVGDLLKLTRNYGRGDFILGWRLSEHWSLEGDYSVTYDKQSGTQLTFGGTPFAYEQKTRNHLFYLQVQWRGLGHH